MLFNSYVFIFLFLPATWLVWRAALALNQQRLGVAWLCLASLFFYGYWAWQYAPLLVLSLFINYVLGQRLAAPSGPAARRLLLGAGLFTFTYRGFDRFTAGDHAERIADDIWSPADGEVRSPIYADGYVYFTQCADLRCYSLRTTPSGLTSTRSYRWWTGSGWNSDRSRRQQVEVGTGHPGGNPSIVRLKNGVYAMADTEAGVVSGIGYLWVAPHPWGPWSQAAPFLMPDCPVRGCYGLNLHPEASTATSLRISYATGEHDPNVRVTDVRIQLDPAGRWISAR
jgi:hypothetical protein